MDSIPFRTNRPDLCLSGILRLQSLTVLTAELLGRLVSLHRLQYCVPSHRTHSGSAKSAREATYIRNQASGLNRCLNKVQQGMTSQLKILQSEHSKGKSVDKVGGAAEELQYLITFNSSITQCMAKTMEHCRTLLLSEYTTSLWPVVTLTWLT